VGYVIDDGKWKAESSGGSIVAHLPVFLDHVSGGDFSSALQVNRIGKYTPGNG
jgi:hypothetical protein